jgi:hypothetical protein
VLLLEPPSVLLFFHLLPPTRVWLRRRRRRFSSPFPGIGSPLRRRLLLLLLRLLTLRLLLLRRSPGRPPLPLVVGSHGDSVKRIQAARRGNRSLEVHKKTRAPWPLGWWFPPRPTTKNSAVSPLAINQQARQQLQPPSRLPRFARSLSISILCLPSRTRRRFVVVLSPHALLSGRR